MNNSKINTEKIIKRFKTLNNEYENLRGVLIARLRMSYKDQAIYRSLIDTSMIAQRMDEINHEALQGG